MAKSTKHELTITEFARMGGYARAAKLTPEQRTASALKAIRTRWRRVRQRRREDAKAS